MASRPSFTPPPQFDEYRIIRALGSGAMGMVYKVRDVELDEIVALNRQGATDSGLAGDKTYANAIAGTFAALALIADDLGEAVARQVARQLVVYYRRPGGQSQFSELAELQPAGGRFAALLDHIRSHLQDRLDVHELAGLACMSPRNFSRCFAAEMGVTPARAVERLRVEAALAALESGAASVQQVARTCGFDDPERMRRAFIRTLGVPPSSRRRAPGSAPGNL